MRVKALERPFLQQYRRDHKPGDNEEHPNAKIGMQEQQAEPEGMRPRALRMADENQDNRNRPQPVQRRYPLPGVHESSVYISRPPSDLQAGEGKGADSVC